MPNCKYRGAIRDTMLMPQSGLVQLGGYFSRAGRVTVGLSIYSVKATSYIINHWLHFEYNQATS